VLGFITNPNPNPNPNYGGPWLWLWHCGYGGPWLWRATILQTADTAAAKVFDDFTLSTMATMAVAQ